MDKIKLVTIALLLSVLLVGCTPLSQPIALDPSEDLKIEAKGGLENSEPLTNTVELTASEDSTLQNDVVRLGDSSPSQQLDPAQADALLAKGIQVYLDNYCGVCHALDAASTNGQFAPHHNNAGSIAEERIRDARYGGAARTAEEYLRESLLEPQAFLVEGYQLTPHRMPPFTHLSEEDLDALVFLMVSQE